jgi:Kelch motif
VTSREESGQGTAIVHHWGVMSLTILIVYTVELSTCSWKGSHMRPVSLIGVAYLLVGACVAAFAQAPMGTWSTAAPLPQPRAEHAVIGLDGKIYAIAGGIPQADGAGMQHNGASTLVEDYDPATDHWRVRAPLPRALTHVGLAALDGKIYAIGGFLGDVHKDAQADAFVYDPAPNQWSTLPALPAPRGSVGTVALNGKLHAIGGRDPQDQVQATHDIFDPVQRTWTPAAPLPVARDHLAAVVVDGKIHVVGGRTGNYTEVTAYHDVYDPASDTWSQAPPLPTPRSAMAATLYKNMIVVFGGECRDGKTFAENEGYDVATGQWKTLQPAEGRHGFGAASVGDRAYFVAGAHGCGSTVVSKELRVFTLP